MADTLRECITNPAFNEIMIATGFWDLPGTRLVAAELEQFLSRESTSMRLLIGTDPTVRRNYLDKKFPDEAIKDDIFKLHFNEEYQPLIDLLFKYCKADPDKSKLKIRIYKRDADGNAQFLHSKCYVFTDNADEAVGIIGSSNFTRKGLEGNAELNYVETDARIVNFIPSENSNLLGHTYWFNEMWEQSEDWNGEFITEILSKAPVAAVSPHNPANRNLSVMADRLTPYEVYIKYLQTQFGDIVDAKTNDILKSYLPTSYKPLEYQLDAVKQGFSIMKRYGGFILGDVVGLGKTVVGLMLIRMFIDQAESLNRPRKVLIVVPPSIKRGWVDTIRDFDSEHSTKIEPCIEFATTGSIGKLIDEEEADGGDDFSDELKQKQYGLIVVDESHNFRNKDTWKYAALDGLINLTNPMPYVCLLSATPQNNTPVDLYNQISLFIRDTNNCKLPNVPGGKLDTFFNQMKQRFAIARNLPEDTPEQRKEAQLIIAEVSKEIRERVLNELVVRRTRTDIRNLYPEDSATLRFPSVKGPHKLEYTMDEELQKLFLDTINALHPENENSADSIQFARYAAITYFKDNHYKRKYEKRNLTVESITARLQKIMKIMLVKRLESSLVAFKSSLSNLLRYTDVMIAMLEHDAVYICSDIDVNKVYFEAKEDFDVFRTFMQKKMQVKADNNCCYRTSDFKSSYLDALYYDRKLISRLLDRWNTNDYDPKFDRFKQAIPELFDPAINNTSGINKPRVVIFTEATDTLKSIKRALCNSGHRPLAITATNRSDMAQVIAANFDANLDPDKQRDDYDAIVTTEVLAEGVNLHRSNVILNYDAPWNATRLMQRIGRVNRIGSVEDFVHVFNFFPSTEGNRQIRLIEKAYAKLQSFHEMFGEDSKVFSEREEIRQNELNHDIDGDESPFGQFIRELKAYSDAYPERYAYIKALPLEHLGGYFPEKMSDGNLYIFSDESESLVSVVADARGKASIISPLLTMEMLKCSPDDRFTRVGFSETSDEYKLALRTYQQHVTHALNGRDSSKSIIDAQEYIRELRNNPEVTKMTRQLLGQINIMVRNKNNGIIKILLKQKKLDVSGQLSIFGKDFDINSWIQTTFSHLAKQAVNRRGQSTLAIYELK